MVFQHLPITYMMELCYTACDVSVDRSVGGFECCGQYLK
jgi:hypothetical protein